MYDLGDVVTLTASITDLDDQPANAGAVACTITLPDGTTEVGAVANPAVGQYSVVYTPPSRGVTPWTG